MGRASSRAVVVGEGATIGMAAMVRRALANVSYTKEGLPAVGRRWVRQVL